MKELSKNRIKAPNPKRSKSMGLATIFFLFSGRLNILLLLPSAFLCLDRIDYMEFQSSIQGRNSEMAFPQVAMLPLHGFRIQRSGVQIPPGVPLLIQPRQLLFSILHFTNPRISVRREAYEVKKWLSISILSLYMCSNVGIRCISILNSNHPSKIVDHTCKGTINHLFKKFMVCHAVD